jgi:hypothetical protein
MIERADKARRSARRPRIPPPRVIPDKRIPMIDRIVQQEIDVNDAVLLDTEFDA